MSTAFWDTFLSESLQQPWRVMPEVPVGSQIPQPQAPFVFVLNETMNLEKEEMLNKMIAALKWSTKKVQILNVDMNQLEDLTVWAETKDILFFGADFPGDMGVIKNWYGHRVGQTFSLQSLLDQAELKRQTWQHLKDFAGIKS